MQADESVPQSRIESAAITVHAPFPYRTKAEGMEVEIAALCRMAGFQVTASTPRPPRIAIHEGADDFVAATRGARIYCMARRRLPKSGWARHIIQRLAYGDGDWMAREILTSSLNRPSAPVDPGNEARRQLARETLLLRRKVDARLSGA